MAYTVVSISSIGILCVYPLLFLVESRWPILFAFRLKKCTKTPMIWVNFLLIRLPQEGSLMQFDPKSRNLKFICLFWKRYVTQVQSINHWNLDSCLKHFESIKATPESLKYPQNHPPNQLWLNPGFLGCPLLCCAMWFEFSLGDTVHCCIAEEITSIPCCPWLNTTYLIQVWGKDIGRWWVRS